MSPFERRPSRFELGASKMREARPIIVGAVALLATAIVIGAAVGLLIGSARLVAYWIGP